MKKEVYFKKSEEINKITRSKEFKAAILKEHHICPDLYLDPTDRGYRVCGKY